LRGGKTILAVLAVLATGCVFQEPSGEWVQSGAINAAIQADVAGLRAELVQVAGDVAAVKVGGGGDSVTAWILAAGAIVGPFAWLAYPLVWRPLVTKRRARKASRLI
jgi:hypothetical protein